jgi:superfamily I DNA/RNA helicase
MRNCRGRIAILTPDSRNQLLLDALTMVNERVWGQGFGPFPFEWEDRDEDTAQILTDEITFPNETGFDDCLAALSPHAEHAAVAAVISRVRRRRRAFGQMQFRREQIEALIEEAVRNQTRHSGRSRNRNVAMTIQRAKNREFPNVVVLWPHSATGSNEHRRRLLYNAVTRATRHCSVVVIGQGLTGRPPFMPEDA